MEENKVIKKSRKVAEGINPGQIKSKHVLDVALRLAMDRGLDTVIYDVKSITPMFDYVILTTGTSDKRLKSLTHEAEAALLDNNFEVGHIEGRKGSTWYLIDGKSIIIHAFLPQVREEVNFEEKYKSLPKRIITEDDLKIYSKTNAQN